MGPTIRLCHNGIQRRADPLPGPHRLFEGVEDELAQELTAIGATWDETAAAITSTSIPLEKSDVKVTQLVLAWLPVP